MRRFVNLISTYIDKTKLIEQILESCGEVNLFTRPRRFGKTLNMSMLRSFFEIGADKEPIYWFMVWRFVRKDARLLSEKFNSHTEEFNSPTAYCILDYYGKAYLLTIY